MFVRNSKRATTTFFTHLERESKISVSKYEECQLHVGLMQNAKSHPRLLAFAIFCALLNNIYACQAGEYLDRGTCRLCLINTFSTGNDICSSCPLGSSTDGLTGITALTGCICGPGYWGTGGSDCTFCGNGNNKVFSFSIQFIGYP